MAGEFSDTPISPDNLPERRLSRENHLLASENFGQAPKAVVVTTGWPEEENEWAQSTKQALNTLFGKANSEMAIAQVYIGRNPRDIFRLSGQDGYLAHALREAKDSKVDLVVFSVGAQALWGLPPDTFKNINSLIIVSPFLGKEGLQSWWRRKMTSLLRLPEARNYCAQIAPLIEHLAAEGKPVILSLGKQDHLIDNNCVRNLFSQNFPNVPVHTEERGHAPTEEQLLALIFQPKNQ